MLNQKALTLNDQIGHGKDIDVICHDGFFLNGPARLRCWFGEWSGGARYEYLNKYENVTSLLLLQIFLVG